MVSVRRERVVLVPVAEWSDPGYLRLLDRCKVGDPLFLDSDKGVLMQVRA